MTQDLTMFTSNNEVLTEEREVSLPHMMINDRSHIDVEEYHLKSVQTYHLLPSNTVMIKTNTQVLDKTRRVEKKLEICVNSHWLTASFNDMICVKHGVIRPSFTGTVFVQVFNKTRKKLTISKNSPIATLKVSKYEY